MNEVHVMSAIQNVRKMGLDGHISKAKEANKQFYQNWKACLREFKGKTGYNKGYYKGHSTKFQQLWKVWKLRLWQKERYLFKGLLLEE